MRTALVAVLIVVVGGPARIPGSAGQTNAQRPTFRDNVDVIAVDVTVVDAAGRPVEGLAASDFSVKVDGDSRRVTAVEFVKANPNAVPPPSPPPASSEAFFTTNLAPQPEPVKGRRVVIAIDQQYLPPGTIAPMMNTVTTFVDNLTPHDQAALVVFPEPGPYVGFTHDKQRVRAALQAFIGNPSPIETQQFDIGVSEALTIFDKERSVTRVDQDFEETHAAAPVLAAVMVREGCTSEARIEQCRREILAESTRIAQKARLDAKITLHALRAMLTGFGSIDGPKTLILISAGLVNDDPSELDTVIRLAESSRTSLNVLTVEPWNHDTPVSAQPNDQPPTRVADRQLQMEGLEALAADGRGAVYRVVGTAEGVFERIRSELSAYYVVAVEAKAADRTRERRKVEVTVRRRGARVRSKQAYLAPAANEGASMEDLVLGMLSSTTAHSELPLRVTTFQQRDTTSDKVRVNVVVSVGQSGTPPGEFALGYSLVNSRDVVVTSSTTKQFLGAGLAGNEPLSYGTAVLVDPGTYALRVGVVDSNGNRGSVIRAVDGTTIVENDLATSDLMIGHRPAAGQPLLPTVEPRITQGGLAAYLELYSPTAIDLDWTTVTFEIARGEDLPALSSEMADILPGAKPSWRVAFAVVPANELPPGRYIARARVERDGTTLSVLARPFVLDGAPSGRTELPPR